MANCYLFSNCKKSSNDEFLSNIKKLNLSTQDTLVFLNAGSLFYPFIDYFKQFPKTHLIMRQCSVNGLIGFFGFNKAFDMQRFFTSINELALDYNNIVFTRGYRATNEAVVMKKECAWLRDYRNKTQHDPTTGYASYYILQDIFNIPEEEITLVNFYGNADSSTGKCPDHDWAFEDAWLQNRKRIFC